MSIVSNPAWLFVIASAIAVVGIVLSFKLSVSSLLSVETSGEEALRTGFQKEFIRFITRLLFIEALPLVLMGNHPNLRRCRGGSGDPSDSRVPDPGVWVDPNLFDPVTGDGRPPFFRLTETSCLQFLHDHHCFGRCTSLDFPADVDHEAGRSCVRGSPWAWV